MKKNPLKLFSLLIICLLFQSQNIIAQSLPGYSYQHYEGVQGMLNNPGSLADNPYHFQLNIFTVQSFATNNAYAVSRQRIMHPKDTGWKEGRDYFRLNSSAKKNGSAGMDILGPSFLINLNKKSTIGLTSRFRTLVNGSNLSENGLEMLTNPPSSLFGINVNEHNVFLNMHAFADLGLAYSKVVKENEHSRIKAGVTLKYYMGISAGNATLKDINFNFKDINSLNSIHGDASFSYAENLDRLNNGSQLDFWKELSAGPKTMGLDFGFVYENLSEQYRVSDKNSKAYYKTVPYNFRLGLSVTDLAFSPLSYSSGKESARYIIDASNIKKDTFNVTNPKDVSDYLNKLQLNSLLTKQSSGNLIKEYLPSVLHLNADWQFSKGLFLNGEAFISLHGDASEKSGSHYNSALRITPRLDNKWLTIASPVSFTRQQSVIWGLGLRAGPVFFGSASIFSNLLKAQVTEADFYAGLSLPFYKGYHPKKEKKSAPKMEPPVYPAAVKDRDKDGVPDEEDACPDIAGLILLKGCPDRDGDGVPDYLDHCPDIKGLPRLNGCPLPDKDGDGVPDETDHCPEVAGPVSNNGCPEVKKEDVKIATYSAENILFVWGKAELRPESFPGLDTLVALMIKQPSYKLRIEGYTDNTGRDEVNLKLSLQRAEAAQRYLVRKGIDATRIVTVGMGSSQPIASNDTPEGRAKNRRIVLKLIND